MATKTWTIKAILDWTTGYLERKGDEHPRLSAEWLLGHVLGMSRVDLYVNFDKPLVPEELDAMHKAIERRAAGEPLQYVTGEMAFRHIVLRCEEGVLIPRPETEVLVDAALEGVDAWLAQHPAPECPVAGAEKPVEGGADESDEDGPDVESDAASEPESDATPAPEPRARVLEVGTGTGCIALSIASERPGVHVTATDLSERAEALACRNREALGLEDAVDIVRTDLAADVDPELMGRFCVLVSNPPYIPTKVLEQEVPAEVKDHEPGLALDGGADGLDVFRRLLELAPQALAPGGMLAVELYEGSLDAAADLARASGLVDVEVREDLTHRPRVLIAHRATAPDSSQPN